MSNNVLQLFEENPPQAKIEPQRFEEWWKAYPYPRRKKKAKCRAKYKAIIQPGGMETQTKDTDSGCMMKIHLEATEEEIISGTIAFSEAYEKPGAHEFGFKDDGKYIPNSDTFLNQGLWEDYE